MRRNNLPNRLGEHSPFILGEDDRPIRSRPSRPSGLLDKFGLVVAAITLFFLITLISNDDLGVGDQVFRGGEVWSVNGFGRLVRLEPGNE